MHTLADGCCSAVMPCSWQQKNPSTICDTCRAASLSVSAWLKQEADNAAATHGKLPENGASEVWARAQVAAFMRAHAYAAARPDRTAVLSSTDPVREAIGAVTAGEIGYIAELAISSKDTTLARIAAALLLAR